MPRRALIAQRSNIYCEGWTAAEALRRSQLALASDKDTSHPFFWAPFVLVGDGGPTAP